MKKINLIHYLKNIIIPCLFFGLITGILTGTIVVLYKWICEHIFELSHIIFNFLREKPYFLPVALAVVFLIAIASKFFFAFEDDAKGGGIPNAVAYVRGLISFKWLRTLICVFFASFFTFLAGTPLDNDGPCVLAGATIGRGVVKTCAKKNYAWDKYVMTGGACAGFAAATNSPVTGMMFALEEAKHKLSPMLIMVTGVSVAFSIVTTRLLAPVFAVNPALFPGLTPNAFELSKMWIPLVIGILCGLISVGFIALFELIDNIISVKLKKVNVIYIIFAILGLSVIFGTISPYFSGTGHGLVEKIIENPLVPLHIVIIAIFVRSTLTHGGASSGITGGIFIPALSIGALFSSLLFRLFKIMGIVDDSYYQLIILLGMSACFSGMIKTPLTAIIFSVEALALVDNILPVVIAVIVSYFITEIFSAQSINDKIMERRIEEQNQGKQQVLIDAMVNIKENSFASGKSIRDILWPSNLFVLTIKHKDGSPLVDEQGETFLKAGDILHIRYSTFDQEETHRELEAIVGTQNYNEREWIE